MHITYKNGLKMSKYKHTGLLPLAIPPTHTSSKPLNKYVVLLRGGFNNSIPKIVFPMNFSQKIFTKCYLLPLHLTYVGHF